MKSEKGSSIVPSSREKAYAVTDQDLVLHSANSVFLRKFNLSASSIKGSSFPGFFREIEQPPLKLAYRECLQNPAECKTIEICTREGNRISWYRWELSVLETDEPGKLQLQWAGTDITEEKKELERKLQQSKIVEELSDISILLDKDLRVQGWNVAAAQSFNIPIDEALGKPIGELLLATPLAETSFNWQDLHTSWSGALLLSSLSGTQIHVNFSSYPFQSRDTNAAGTLIICRILPEPIKQDSPTETLGNWFSSSDQAVLTLDSWGYIRESNERAALLTGYKLQEIVGKHIDCFYSKEEKENGLPYNLLEKAAEMGSCQYEGWRFRKDGSSFWASVNIVALLNAEAELTGYSKVTNDLSSGTSAAIQSSRIKYLSEVFEKLGDNTWEHDFRLKKTKFSSKITDLLGDIGLNLENAADHWWKHIHPEDLAELKKIEQAYNAGTIDRHKLEYRMYHRNGSIRWILDTGVVVEKDLHGKPLRTIGTHTDITRRKQNEEALMQSERRFRDLVHNVPGVVFQWKDYKDGRGAFLM